METFSAVNSTLQFLHIYHLYFYSKNTFLPLNSENILRMVYVQKTGTTRHLEACLA
jgi:hypothetical protein